MRDTVTIDSDRGRRHRIVRRDLTKALTKAGERVVEVNRPNRLARRMDGKSDRLDAEQIARAVLARLDRDPEGQVRHGRGDPDAAGHPRERGQGPHQAFHTLWGVMISAPSPLRDELVVLTKRTLVNQCLRLRPETDELLELVR